MEGQKLTIFKIISSSNELILEIGIPEILREPQEASWLQEVTVHWMPDPPSLLASE